ncbi:hypothetical protein MTX80_23215 (plasmid) [Gordonia amicalis]|nr:hypothetical protein [Gordonia amicalis]UOG23829.1 hypothetical protein MTX80_23215 [Gordonia amicalis]
MRWMEGEGTARAKGLAEVLNMGVHEVAELFRVAEEYVRAVELLLRGEEPLPIPMLSLVRSIQEALLEVCWATDPSINSPLRVARSAALFLRTVQGNIAPLKWFPGDAKLAEVWEAVDGAHRLLSDRGFTFQLDKSGKLVTSLAYGADSGTAAIKVNITKAATRYMTGSEQMWEVGSGATHSRKWFTGGLEGPEDLLYIMAVTPMFDFADAVIDNIHGYVGLSTEDFHTKTHFRRVALLQKDPRRNSAAAQASYADYAAKRAVK